MTRFEGKLVLVLLDDKEHTVLKAGRALWGLERPLGFRDADGALITVPAGFVTDLASIPRWAWVVLPPDGPWVKAAVVHDFLYATRGTGVWKDHPAAISRAVPYARREADAVLRDGMADRGVDPLRRELIHLAVRVGGAAGWGH